MEKNNIIARAEKNPKIILLGFGTIGSLIPFILGIFIFGAVLNIPDGLLSDIILWLLLFSIPIILIWAVFLFFFKLHLI